MSGATRQESEPVTIDSLQATNADLRDRLETAEETIRAIQQGAVDAFVLEELASYRVYTLEGADRHYRMFVEQMQQGVATLHADGAIVYCNRRLAELLKVPHEQLVGASLRDFIGPEHLPIYENLLWQGKTRSGRGETLLRRSDGALLPAYLTFSALAGDTRGLIGVFVTDLTAQKHHEELAAVQKALRDADHRKNEFLAMLAHELRNPLAPIRNAVRILQQKSDDVAAVQAASAMLDRQVGHMVRLVDELLDISRITRNAIELRKERIELASVIRQAIENSQPMCENMRHAITVALPGTAVYLDGDPVRLTQVFSNLLDNACKYTEKGGRIRIGAEVAQTENGSPAEVVVRVSDGGIGIAAEHLPRIFDLFAQVDTSLERAQGGLGIGLTLVKRLVELHGGRVEARSDGLGHGSELVVHLPIAAAEVRVGAESKPANAAARYRILVADDNQDSAESLALLLKLNGHETYAALDGKQAIEAATTLRPDVVLLDIGMPELNGYDACRTIRANFWGKNIVLIAQTGFSQPEDKRRMKDAGFDAHLVKPVDPVALMTLIASLAQGAEAP